MLRNLRFSLLVSYLSRTLPCSVFIDLDSFNSLDLSHAQTSPSFLSVQGSWWSGSSAQVVEDAEWRQALSNFGAKFTVSQDISLPVACNSLPLLSPSGTISAAAFISNPSSIMLNNSQIRQSSLACGGSYIIGSTSDFLPGLTRIFVEETLSNRKLLGVVMDTPEDLDYGSLNEDDFAAELLASNKRPIFRMPFMTPNAKKFTSEEQVQSFGDFLRSSSKFNLSDDRIVLLIANYASPPLNVIGPTNSVESALRAALNVCSKPAPSSSTILFKMPDGLEISNSSLARVNPTNGIMDQTVLTVWRLGDEALTNISSWDSSEWTNARPFSPQVGMTPSLPGSSSVLYSNGTFGALLSTIANPIQNGSSLGTLTIEYNYSPQYQTFPWTSPSAVIDMSVLYEAPQAYRTGIAVYSSWSLGILNRNASTFCWFETALWDLERDLGGDEIWHDTISGNVIVHGVLGAQSAFHSMAFDSASARNTTFATGKELLHFTISSSQIRAAINSVNLEFNFTLDANPANWALVHTNIELEGTSGVRGGHSLSSMRIMLND